MRDFIQLIRIHQWVKNTFVFFPAFFGNQLFDADVIIRLIGAFFCFSFVASSIYIINDYVDIEKDREHPEKKDRPLASGAISKKAAQMMFLVMFALGIGGAFLLDYTFLFIVGGYFIMNLLYSFKLKHMALVDVSTISVGFVLRIFAGGAVTGIFISHWLILMTFLLAMLLALAKRRDDLVIFEESGKQLRKSLDGYNMEFVNAAMVLMSSATLVAYILYTVSPEVQERIGSPYVYLTSIFVILGLLRYIQIALVEKKSGSPTKVLMRDLFIQIVFIAWIITFGIMLYA